MKELKTFNTYNQITKKFDIVSMNKQEIQQLNKNEQYLVLFPKKKSIASMKNKTNKRHCAPVWFQEFENKLNSRLNNYDKLFREHGWTK